MRLDLETIKKIEYYLTNNMSVIEKKLFEQEMSNSKELRDAVTEQQNLTLAMERSSLKSIAVNAGIRYRRNQLIKYVAVGCTVVVMIVGSYFAYEGLNKPDKVSEDAVVENVVPQGESTQPNTSQTSPVDSIASGEVDSMPTQNYKLVTQTITDHNRNIGHDEKKTQTNRDLDTFKVKFNRTNNDLKMDDDVKTDNIVTNLDSFKSDVKLLADNDKIFHHFTKESEFFTVSTKKDIKIKGIEGTKITIPQGTLVDSTGKAITGSVRIQLMEFYKKSDLIFADLHTQSDNKLLESGGTIYISITQNDEEVYIAPDRAISIQFTNKQTKDSMLLFNGVETNGKLDWKLNELYKTTIDTVYGKLKGKTKVRGGATFHRGVLTRHDKKKKGDDMFITTYNPGFDNLILQTTQMGWINCDRFRESKNNTSLTVKYNTGYAPIIRIAFPHMNSLMGSNISTDTETIFNNIPLETEVDIVAFAMWNDEPYYFIKRVTIHKDHVEVIDLQKTTLDDLQRSIKALDSPRKSNDFRLMN